MRSLWHLSRHLTARADDNHAAPSFVSRRKDLFPSPSLTFKPGLGSSRIIELNHMFLRLCGPPSIPLSFILANVLPRWIAYRFLLVTDRISLTTSYHRLLRGLPGYLILFDTHAFVHQCQSRPGRLPSRSGFCVISMHFTATPRIPPAPYVLKLPSFNGSPMVEPRAFTADLRSHLRTL